MIRFHVGQIGDIASARGNFFDRAKVKNRISRAERKVLSRFGAFVRQRDRTSQRRRKAVSDPGRPPSAHVGLVRDFTFFAYDPAKRSVVIGPALLGRRGTKLALAAGALRTLEEGGEGTRIVGGKRRRVRYRARPHTKPAFDAELRKMPAAFQATVTE